MSRSSIVFTRCFSTMFALSYLFVGCAKHELPPVPVGHIVPRNGAGREVGERAMTGVQIAVKEANAGEKPMLGRTIETHHPETSGTPEEVEAQAVRLVRFTRTPALLGGTDAAQAQKLARIAQDYGVPVVTTSWMAPQDEASYAFSVGISPTEQGKSLARYAHDELKVWRMLVLVRTGEAQGNTLAGAFADAFRKNKSKTAEVWNYKDDGELTDLLARTKPDGTDAVLLVGTSADLHKLARDVTMPILYGGPEASLRPGAGNVPNHVCSVTAYVPEDATPAAQEFAKEYESRLHEPPDAVAVLSHDSARVLFEAMKRAGRFTGERGRQQVRDELRTMTDFPSLTGPLSFDKTGHAVRPVFVVKWEAGKAKKVKRYEGGKD